MPTTPNLGLTKLEVGQANKETTINENYDLLDAGFPAGLGYTGAHVYNNANISINNITTTELTFNSERYDTDTIHSTSADTGRLTFPFAGKWVIGLQVRWAINATGVRQITIMKNGTTVLAAQTVNAVAGGVFTTDMTTITEHTFAATDYVVAKVHQTSGGALNVEFSADFTPEFWCRYQGA